MGTAAWLSTAFIMSQIQIMLVFSGLQSKNLCRNPPCPTLSQADGEADDEQRGTTSAGSLLVSEI